MARWKSGSSALARGELLGYGEGMKQTQLPMGVFIAIGAGLGVAFMPMAGPLALAIGVALGVVLGAIVETQRQNR
jgi:uncharacterized ion transporter superfamily protein YfcC